MNNYSAWSAMGSGGGKGAGTDAFAGRIGDIHGQPGMAAPAPQKKSSGFLGTGIPFDPLGADMVGSLITRGTWKGPMGEFKNGDQENQFIDLRGGDRPVSSHSNFLGHWGAGEKGYEQPDGGYGEQAGGPWGMWRSWG